MEHLTGFMFARCLDFANRVSFLCQKKSIYMFV